MSRLHWARISVTEHDETRAAAFGDAVASWQDGAEVRAHSGTDGEVLFDMTFSLSGGWQMSAAAKSHA